MVATFTGGDFYFCPIPPIWGIMTFLGVIMPGKRENYISWDEYFMGIAILSAMRSKDPNTQVGACIVSPDRKIVGVGYNGFPTGCSDDELPWAREGDWIDTKYPYVCHAEKVIYLSDKYRDTDATKASRMMLIAAGVELVQLRTGKKELILHFNE